MRCYKHPIRESQQTPMREEGERVCGRFENNNMRGLEKATK
jgi:hypothetical protein